MALTILETALKLAERGIPVFPIKNKIPMTANSFYDATTIREQIIKWFDGTDYSIAIPTGPLSGVCAIDIDKHDKDGFESLKTLEESYGPIDQTVYQTTGGGGKHYFFRWEKGIGTRANVYSGIDVRGAGGSITMAPSVHPNGKLYEWGEDASIFDHELPDAPKWLVQYFSDKNKPKTARQYSTQLPTIEDLNQALGRLKHERCEEYQDWLEIGMAIHAGTEGSDEGFELWDTWSQQSDKYKGGECQRLWEAFSTDGGLTHRTLFKLANDDNPPQKNPATLLDYERTDLGHAKMMLHYMREHGVNVRYNATRAQWRIHNGFTWVPDYTNRITQYAKLTAFSYKDLASQVVDPDAKTTYMKHANAMQEMKSLSNSVNALKLYEEVITTETDWEKDKVLLGCANCVLNLETGEVIKNDPSVLVSKSTNVIYNPAAKAPKWIAFIEDVLDGNQEVMRFVQKAVGYTLSGMTDEQVLFLLLGSGSNGKSVFISTLLRLLGDYAQTATFDTFTYKGNTTTASNDIAKLVGARLVCASETNQGTRFDEAKIKSLTGGESVTARFLYQDYFSYFPEFKLWLGVNHLPTVRDDSSGFWRRLRTITFPKSYTGNQVDKRLPEKLANELSGILNWAIEGFKMWLDEGLEPPESVKNSTRAYQLQSDPVYAFVVDALVLQEASYVGERDMFNTYTDWCKAVGKRPYEIMDLPKFKESMSKYVTFVPEHKQYIGVALKSND